LSIEKDGKSYTKDDFDGYAEVHMVKDENVKIGSGINAIKYHYSEGDNGDYYMFVYNDNIYEINVPTNERIQDEVQEFLDSVTIETEIQ
jgi:hypothetical protein